MHASRRPGWPRLAAAIVAALALTGGAAAEDDLAPGASRAQAATVTLRVGKSGAAETPSRETVPDADPVRESAAGRSVEVFSGVLVAADLVATASFPPAADPHEPVRVTLAGGKQATGRLRVLDRYSQAALIQLESPQQAFAELAEDAPPPVGAWVLSAAAWGNEAAVVSLGIVSGVHRTIEGADLPPVLQCDLRSAATSGGAGVFDRDGRLLGLVLAVQRDSNQAGWTFAIPGEHVRRVLRAWRQHAAGPDADQLLVLQRRRPTLGMILEQEGERIVIDRVQPDSPAAAAGLQAGDQLLAVNGAWIRSVYQAVRPVMRRQPGDVLQLQVRRNGEDREVEVVLGGGAVLPEIAQRAWVTPRIEVQGAAVGEVSAGPEDLGGTRPGLDNPPESRLGRGQEDAMQLLQRALQAYQAALAAQQEQLEQTKAALRKAEEELRRLRETGPTPRR